MILFLESVLCVSTLVIDGLDNTPSAHWIITWFVIVEVNCDKHEKYEYHATTEKTNVPINYHNMVDNWGGGG